MVTRASDGSDGSDGSSDDSSDGSRRSDSETPLEPPLHLYLSQCPIVYGSGHAGNHPPAPLRQLREHITVCVIVCVLACVAGNAV